MNKNALLITGLIIVIVVIALFILKYFVSIPGPGTISKNVVPICEMENPLFNYTLECQNIVSSNYSDKKCTFSLDNNTEWLPLGSCKNCTIICSK